MQPLAQIFLQTEGNFDEEFPEQWKKPLTLCFYQMVPYVMLFDGWTCIETIFTKDAVNGFRKNFSHIKWSQLAAKVVKATKWSFQLRYRDQKEVANNHANLSLYLVVSEFQPMMHLMGASTKEKINRLCLEPIIQNWIMAFRHSFQKKLIAAKV